MVSFDREKAANEQHLAKSVKGEASAAYLLHILYNEAVERVEAGPKGVAC